ncbi:conjugal transfer protein TraO [Aquimarina sp. MMG016]|uniref:conjugal transfer protein TraO n=1 Tax=Aquimarina sp. MMG016 TaxID=2822690 RepID=UPI001B3A518B|nr:conjugal transfer protein TraO [Aquimarina sp. MMG016]MBQ4821932.1 conjugal transfer protein TraO [Aquimarina sp. MMG016]
MSFNRSLLIITLFFVSLISYSQSHKIAASLTGGIVQDGFSGMATLDYKVNEFDYLQLNLQASFSEIELENIDVPVDLYSFNGGFFFDILRNNSRTFALSIGAGGTIGYETINGGDEVLENNSLLTIDTGKIVYGAYAGIDADIFLNSTLALNIKANEIYHINSDVGEFTPYVGLGAKLILK